ncbi:MAG: YraN family protein [Chitinophagaceae bacterium]|nr:MAG: YraN family protein [Chitinophagaceae bacterium]
MKNERAVIGKNGEDSAADYLEKNGFEILERNWRYLRGEIDIIATKDNVLHIVEVKTRTSTTFGFPEESINDKKLRKLMVTATAYCYQHPGWEIVQYDVVAILNQEVLFIEDV